MKKRDDKHVAEGETTGHYHEVIGEAEVWGDGDQREIRAKEPVTLRHQEHHEQTIAPGDYDTSLVKEYDPFAEEIRVVRD